jgi:Sec-independent protein translocase protein TatA
MTDLALVLVIVLVMVIIWRGPKTLPLLGRAFGQGVREARKEMNEIRSKGDEETEPPGSEPPPTDR